jgi:sugar/nucleoside kinase (ribokinase family)
MEPVDGRNSILAIPQANLRLTAADVEAAKDSIRSARVLLVQFEVAMEATLRAMQIARDAGHRGGFYVRDEYRSRAFQEFQCAFGSSSKAWVYMPQRWDKLRWFLPTILHSCGFLKEDFRSGARAAEIFMGATLNPGVEMTILCCGKMLNNPERDIPAIMYEAVEELYAPKNRKACEKLVDIFAEAEKAYFSNSR